MSFKKLGLSAELLLAVKGQGYTEPTPVQQQVIPAIIDGRDIIAAAQTGTGKTAGFTLPLLHRLANNPKPGKKIRALILTPTRELAAQVHKSVETYSKHLPFKSCAVFGGVKIYPQISKIRKGCDIVIATPGRLLDLVNQRAINLSAIEILVLDEADRMLDMGFMPDIQRIIQLLPKERQGLMFSATYTKEIKKLANNLLNKPESIEVASRSITADRITQVVHPVDQKRKRELLSFIIGSENWKQVLVFTRTKHGASRLATQLESDGLSSTAIHGDKTQGARTRALDAFKKNKVRVLVATDVAARGLDIEKLAHVVNYDLPGVPEDYVHRIGRTGRASNDGLATSLVSVDEMHSLRSIERLLKCTLKQKVFEGFEPDPTIKPAPEKKKRVRGRTRKSAGGGSEERRKPARGEGRRKSARGDERKKTTDGEGRRKTARGEGRRSSARGEERKKTAGGEGRRSSVRGDERKKAAGGEGRRSSARGEERKNTAGGEGRRSSARGEERKNTAGGEGRRSSARGEERKNTAGGEEKRRRPKDSRGRPSTARKGKSSRPGKSARMRSRA